MRDFGKEYFEQFMYEKIIPEILGEVRAATGYNGGFKINFKPWWNFTLRNPTMRAVYSTITKEIKKIGISIKEPRLSSNSPWDVFFYCWDIAHEGLHYVDLLLSNDLNEPTSGECEIHIASYSIVENYMKEKYPAWYKENLRIFREMRRVVIHPRHDLFKFD